MSRWSWAFKNTKVFDGGKDLAKVFAKNSDDAAAAARSASRAEDLAKAQQAAKKGLTDVGKAFKNAPKPNKKQVALVAGGAAGLYAFQGFLDTGELPGVGHVPIVSDVAIATGNLFDDAAAVLIGGATGYIAFQVGTSVRPPWGGLVAGPLVGYITYAYMKAQLEGPQDS